MNLQIIESLLVTKYLARSKNELWEEIDSTNNRAIELARSGIADGLIIARSQTAGRGRSGNTWVSPVDAGLYMSFILKPNLSDANLSVLTLIAGVVVAEAIQTTLGIKLGLKWVNDLIVNGKKVGGILAEYVSGKAVVIGIGLNITSGREKLPADLQSKIGFLASSIKDNINVAIDSNKLVASIANELEKKMEDLPAKLPAYLDAWRAYSITLGEEIKAMVGDKEIIGEAIDIESDGSLLVRTKEGNVTINAGEVTIRKLDGSYV